MKRIIFMIAAAMGLAVACGDPDDGPVAGNGTLTIEADKVEVVADGEDYVEITVKYDGEVVAEEVDFYDASTNVPARVKANRFTSKTTGQYSIYAIYNGVKSNVLKITALEYAVPSAPADPDPQNVSFRKRVLFTQFTSTGCVYCPIVTGFLRELAADAEYKDKFVLGASHADMPGYQNGEDPAAYSEVNAFMSAFGIEGFPTLIADFGDRLGSYSLAAVKALVDEYYGDGSAAAGIAVNSEIHDNVLVMRASVKAAKAGKYRIGAWLLEDGIYGKQTGAPDESYYVHDHCIRVPDAESHFMGYDLGMIGKGKSADHAFVMKLDPKWNIDNCSLLLYVTSASGSDQIANNAVIVPLGKSVAYEYR